MKPRKSGPRVCLFNHTAILLFLPLINKTDYELINTFKLTVINILKYRYVLVGANLIAVWDHEF